MSLDIMVPFWGDPALLRRTVESVLAQASDDWHLTVVDDAYPDPSVADWFAQLDHPQVDYRRNESNQGIVENFRACVRMATRERLVVLGCDDVLLPNYVELITSVHRADPTCEIIQPGVEVIDDTGAVVLPLVDRAKRWLAPSSAARQVLAGEELAVSLLRGNWLYWPSLAFRRDSVQAIDFRDGFPVVLDLALVIDLVLAGARLCYEPTTCFQYRRHEASLSSASALQTRFAEDRTYFQLAAELMRERGWPRAARTARRRLMSRAHAVALMPRALRSGDRNALRLLTRHVVRVRPEPAALP